MILTPQVYKSVSWFVQRKSLNTLDEKLLMLTILESGYDMLSFLDVGLINRDHNKSKVSNSLGGLLTSVEFDKLSDVTTKAFCHCWVTHKHNLPVLLVHGTETRDSYLCLD